MRQIADVGEWPLDVQLRSYSCLEMIQDNGCSAEDAAAFIVAYREFADRLDGLFDPQQLKAAAEDALRPLEVELEESRFRAAAAASLHEYAKEAFETWQTAGVFMRRRVLRDLRERAGFRLESHRIGNYVAKTYDLMEEARLAFQKVQQEVYSANVSYKCTSNIYKVIYEHLNR